MDNTPTDDKDITPLDVVKNNLNNLYARMQNQIADIIDDDTNKLSVNDFWQYRNVLSTILQDLGKIYLDNKDKD